MKDKKQLNPILLKFALFLLQKKIECNDCNIDSLDEIFCCDCGDASLFGGCTMAELLIQFNDWLNERKGWLKK